MFGGFYDGKRVLVTGVAGVKATWLALELLEAGSQVVGVDVKSPDLESNFTASGLKQKITFVRGDVTSLQLMKNLMRDVDCVFHLAAVVLVGEADRMPLETYINNTLGTATVLEAVRLTDSVKYAVIVTTDKVYKAKGNGAAWLETDPLVATGPYAVSKACAEYIFASYYESYLRPAGKRASVGRAGNVVIGGDFHSSSSNEGSGRIFVDCVESLIQHQPPRIFNPSGVRPYTYGLDIVAGYMTLMSSLDREGVSGEAFNFGPHEQFGVENGSLATRICESWGSSIGWRSGTSRVEPFDQQAISWEKARRELSWQPAYTLDEALRDTVRWYREWSDRSKGLAEGSMYEFNMGMVHKHRETARNLGIWWALDT